MISSGESSKKIRPAAVEALFDIFRSGACRSITRAPTAGIAAVGTTKVFAVAGVEADREVPGELEVLALVVADGHRVGVVQEDVGRHQHRVGEQARPDRLLAGALLLELGHPLQLAVGGGALEEPFERGVLGDLALYEERAAIRIEPDGDQADRRCRRSAREAPRGRSRASRACRSTTQ